MSFGSARSTTATNRLYCLLRGMEQDLLEQKRTFWGGGFELVP